MMAVRTRRIRPEIVQALAANAVDVSTLSAEDQAKLETEEEETEQEEEEEAAVEETEETEESEEKEEEVVENKATKTSATKPVAKETDTVLELTRQIAQLSTDNAKLDIQNTELKAKLENLSETEKAAKECLVVAATRLSLPLNEPTTGMESMSLSALAKHFMDLDEKFKTRMPVGAVSRSVTTLKEDEKSSKDSAELGRRVSIVTKTR